MSCPFFIQDCNRFLLESYKFVVCHELMLGIELDGYSHNFEEVYQKDQVKQAQLEKPGISILRFDDREVLNDIDNVLRSIENFILDYEQRTHP